MVHARRTMMLSVCTALMLAVLSIVSAHHMAPDRDSAARPHAFHAMGMSAEDVCGLEEAAHHHRCPFCHQLPEAPRIAAPDQQRRIVQVVVAHSGHDLVLGPQHHSAHVSVRAPPLSI